MNRQLTEEKMHLVSKTKQKQPHSEEVQLSDSGEHVSTCAVANGLVSLLQRGGVDGVAFSAKFTFLDLAGSWLGLSYRMKAPALTCSKVFI